MTPPPKKPDHKKRTLRWREMTDEQRWERIYKDRRMKAANRISSLKTAVWLALPAYVMLRTVNELHGTGLAAIRADAHKSLSAAVGLVASRLIEKERPGLADRCERLYGVAKRTGFFTDGREFLYASAYATVILCDEWRYPPDGPASLAAVIFKEDAEDADYGNEWGLAPAHARAAAKSVYRTYIDTELFPAIVG